MSKRMELDAALAAHVEPKMSVHITTQARAATRALQRLFHGQALDLTLIIGRVGGGHAADLVASGIVRHVVAGSYGAVSRLYTGKLRQVEKAHAGGGVTFQQWSFWTLIQRLMAAAQGQPYALTHSLAGSSMARDNPADYREAPDPFGSGAKVGMVRALHPDLAILHVLAADEDGNAILVPPMEEGAWGAKASRGGAIVTAEKLVSREFVRRHSHLVRLPSRYVRAVCHVPFGAHPGAFGTAGIDGLDGYAEDEAFNAAYFEGTRDPAALSRWTQRWITGLRDHAEYLDRLGPARLASLRPRPTPARVTAVQAAAPTEDRISVTDNELLMTLALREVMRRAIESSCDVLMVGAGLSEVPATAAYCLLREQGRDVYLTMGHGYFGFEPVAGRSDPDPATATMITDAPEIYGVVLGGRPGGSLAILGAAQVDRQGNLNSTLVDGKLLIGSGGSNDASAVCQTLVVTRTAKRKLVERVEYVTCAGTRVRAVITERGVFEKSEGNDDLLLTRYVDPQGVGRNAALAELAGRCGWPLAVSDALVCEAPPSAAELEIIRRLMPSRYE